MAALSTTEPAVPVAPRDHPLLAPYAAKAALEEAFGPDGKSVLNPKEGAESSVWYQQYQAPIKAANNGFDIHIYYPDFTEGETDASKLHPDTVYALALRERIRREFPELRCYKVWSKPVGPHPTAMFELNVFTPAQFGAIVPFLVANRGNLSILVHPNTHDDVADHSTNAMWLGPPVKLDIDMLRAFVAKRDAAAKA